MKNILVLILSLLAFTSFGQISLKTGSLQLDSDLNTINTNASVDFGSFKTDLSLSYKLSEKKIDYMKGSLNMSPGEIYFALEISKHSRKPINEVLTIYKKNKSKGWGHIAKEAGIKPGSAEFHQLKNNARSRKNKSKGKNKGHKKGKGKGKKK